jgi:hypothetical protein
MIVTYLLSAMFVVWSARAIWTLWRASRGDRLRLRFGDETGTAAFGLCAWYLAVKIIGWS